MAYKKIIAMLSIIVLAGTSVLTGCSASDITEHVGIVRQSSNTDKNSQESAQKEGENNAGNSEKSGNQGTDGKTVNDKSTKTTEKIKTLDTSEMFTERDQQNTYDASAAETIQLKDGASKSASKNVEIDGDTVTIKAEGVYVLSGTLSDGQIVVDADEKDKVQIVLDGVQITNKDSACIYAKKADKVFVTTADGSKNALTVSGEYANTDDNKVNAAIYSKTDLVLNGKGETTVNAKYGSGVVSKDDLKACGGTWKISAEKHGLSGKDSVRVSAGSYEITAGKDGIHSGNDEDADKGYVYLAGGDISISAESDGIHAETVLQIDDGNLTVEKSSEGLEGQTIIINGGTNNITSSDDGINATSGGSGTGGGRMGRGNQDGTDVSGDGRRMPPGMDGDATSDDASTGDTDGSASGTRGGRMHSDGHRFGRGRQDASAGSEAENQTSSERSSSKADNQTGSERSSSRMDNQAESGSRNSGTESRSRADNSGRGSRMQDAGKGDFGGRGGGMGFGGFGADDSCSLTINGGTTDVNAGGDGLDSNGSITVNGGEVYVSGPTNDGNGALDYGTSAAVNGGTLIAVGAAGMAENFGSDSTQGSILVNLQSSASGKVQLLDSDGNVLCSYTPAKQYNSVIVTTNAIKDGQSYTLAAGDTKTEIKMDGLIYGEGSGFGHSR